MGLIYCKLKGSKRGIQSLHALITYDKNLSTVFCIFKSFKTSPYKKCDVNEPYYFS